MSRSTNSTPPGGTTTSTLGERSRRLRLRGMREERREEISADRAFDTQRTAPGRVGNPRLLVKPVIRLGRELFSNCSHSQ